MKRNATTAQPTVKQPNHELMTIVNLMHCLSRDNDFATMKKEFEDSFASDPIYALRTRSSRLTKAQARKVWCNAIAERLTTAGWSAKPGSLPELLRILETVYQGALSRLYRGDFEGRSTNPFDNVVEAAWHAETASVAKELRRQLDNAIEDQQEGFADFAPSELEQRLMDLLAEALTTLAA